MALVGGGGAGNVAGSNPTGLGSTINYIGDHVYGSNSVDTGTQNTAFTIMEFTTGGSSYIVANIQFGTSNVSSDDFLYSVNFNGETIMGQATDHVYRPNFGQPLKVVIAPGTTVQLTATNLSSGTARTIFTTITGRIYA